MPPVTRLGRGGAFTGPPNKRPLGLSPESLYRVYIRSNQNGPSVVRRVKRRVWTRSNGFGSLILRVNKILIDTVYCFLSKAASYTCTSGSTIHFAFLWGDRSAYMSTRQNNPHDILVWRTATSAAACVRSSQKVFQLASLCVWSKPEVRILAAMFGSSRRMSSSVISAHSDPET